MSFFSVWYRNAPTTVKQTAKIGRTVWNRSACMCQRRPKGSEKRSSKRSRALAFLIFMPNINLKRISNGNLSFSPRPQWTSPMETRTEWNEHWKTYIYNSLVYQRSLNIFSLSFVLLCSSSIYSTTVDCQTMFLCPLQWLYSWRNVSSLFRIFFYLSFNNIKNVSYLWCYYYCYCLFSFLSLTVCISLLSIDACCCWLVERVTSAI